MSIFLFIILTAITSAVLTIVFANLLKPLKSYFFDRYSDRCMYPGEGGRSRSQAVTVTKRFGRVVHIDCPYWQIREKIKNGDLSYIYCPNGDDFECDAEPEYKCKKCKFT